MLNICLKIYLKFYNVIIFIFSLPYCTFIQFKLGNNFIIANTFFSCNKRFCTYFCICNSIVCMLKRFTCLFWTSSDFLRVCFSNILEKTSVISTERLAYNFYIWTISRELDLNHGRSCMSQTFKNTYTLGLSGHKDCENDFMVFTKPII